MRTLVDIFGQTLRTLWAHKLRSFLTMFGIAWGVGSLLLLAGVGEGFRNGNRRQLETFGKNIIFFFGGRAPAVEGSFNSMKWFNLTYDDYRRDQERIQARACNISPRHRARRHSRGQRLHQHQRPGLRRSSGLQPGAHDPLAGGALDQRRGQRAAAPRVHAGPRNDAQPVPGASRRRQLPFCSTASASR